MTVLRWDKPKKVLTVDQWANAYGFDSGPTGGYAPNMSEADQLSWKAKITGKKLGFPQVEIRKTTTEGSQVLIIVNLGEGYNYKQYRAHSERYYGKTPADFTPGYITQARIDEYAERDSTKGINIHMATNGPIQMTFEEMAEMTMAIEEAKQALESLT